MRVMFCGGGTGGHVTPALAMADILRQNFKNPTVAFVGRSGGEENGAITREGEKLYTLDISGLKRSFSLANAKSAIKAVRARRKATKIIADFSPDIIIGTGGYVSWPVLSAGISRGIPTVIHESNAKAGLVTRLLSGKCDYVLLNHPEAKEELKKGANVIFCPNPLRKSFSTMTKAKARSILGIKKEERLILSFGGSLGAEKMNLIITELMQKYGSMKKNVRFVHSTGVKNYEKVMATLSHSKLGNGCEIVPYINDMPLYLSAADVAVTRCGALTLSELAATATPAVLIPSPNVTDNHQYENARAYAKSGGAEVITEDELTSELLEKKLAEILENPSKMRIMENGMKKMRSESPEKIVTFVIKKAIKSKAEILPNNKSLKY